MATKKSRSSYSDEGGETICAALAEGHSLLSICEAMGIPYATARGWETEGNAGAVAEHVANAARAREAGCHALADQALNIADTPMLGVVRTIKPDGAVEERHEDMTQHRRLQIDTRKWLLSRWLPKVYGDRTVLAGDPEAPLLGATTMTDQQLAEIARSGSAGTTGSVPSRKTAVLTKPKTTGSV